ncbi:MAG: peptidase C13 [Zoogloeaceae bacterium]|nr:peptidase C13 [Zoogloeaceae bacterium]
MESASPIASPAPGPIAAFAANLAAGLGALLFRPGFPARLRPSPPQLLALLALPLLGSAAFQWTQIGGPVDFDPAGLPTLFFGVPWLLLTAWAAARGGLQEGRFLAAAVALAALWAWVAALQLSLILVPPSVWRSLGDDSLLLWWSPAIWGLAASVPALARAASLEPERRVAALLAVVLLLPIPLWVESDTPLFTPRETAKPASAAPEARRELAAREAVLYTQPRLLDEALARLRPGQRGVPEVFLLAVGGYGGQDVFLREVQSVEALFRARFGTQGHSLVLANNPTTVGEIPIASVTALGRSLTRIGQLMNRDEDVLFLFMTSHGSPDYRFDLSLWPYRFDDLTPERLRSLLDQAGIRYRVVLVSACYSGGFVPVLAGPDTLAMSAAAADRNSHGCSHGADWTFFGRAYFQEALDQTRSFETAFDIAREAVGRRESDEGVDASLPQIAVGNGIRVALKGIERVGE